MFPYSTEVNLDSYKFEYGSNVVGNNSSIKSSVSKGGKMLYSISIKGNVDSESENVKEGDLKLDILGRVQIAGTISDVRKFSDYLDKACDYDNNESKFKSYISLANDLADLKVYYDNGLIPQAKVQLEPFQKDDYDDYWYYGDSYKRWFSEPVFYFANNTSFTTAKVFFNEGFEKVTSKFESLLDNFEY